MGWAGLQHTFSEIVLKKYDNSKLIEDESCLDKDMVIDWHDCKMEYKSVKFPVSKNRHKYLGRLAGWHFPIILSVKDLHAVEIQKRKS
ncbi:hypothetical protein Glove_126g32 [Diversispora epigaea]|uniref:Uncharacterized protein n=1 Tax=Diversispora epigaea TaxID=1348612 RepID=A0A397J278_9GLOM|nr:hypothetical protein Glove_126g32 [Diversispora epigaea]